MSIAPPGAHMVYWFKADAGVTKNASNQVSDWEDQGPNGWDVHATNSSGAPIADAAKAVWTDNVINGLPGLFYSDTGPGTAVGTLMHLAQSSPTPVPIASDAQRSVLALVKRNNSYGGIITTHRLAGVDYEFGLWNNSPTQLYGFVSSTNGTLLDDLNNYQNTPIVIDWEFYGYSQSNAVSIAVNGQNKTWTLSGPLQQESGSYGFSIGNVNSVGASRGFSGWITEVLMYDTIDPAIYIPARTYLMRRAGLIGNARPALQASTGPSATIGAAATGHLYRYSPKAFGDVFNNPGQT